MTIRNSPTACFLVHWDSYLHVQCTSEASQYSCVLVTCALIVDFLFWDLFGRFLWTVFINMLNMSISNRERFCNCFAYSSASCLDIRTGRPGAEPLLLWVVRRIKKIVVAAFWNLWIMLWYGHMRRHIITRLTRLIARVSFAQIDTRKFWQQSLTLNDSSWPFTICTCSTVDGLVFVKGKSQRCTPH